ncbi:MAG: DUF2208 family protein [Desulfurococcaceae archaeon]
MDGATLTNVLTQVAIIIVLSLMTAINPQYGFLAFLIVYFGFLFLFQRVGLGTSKPPNNLGPPLFRAGNVTRVMLSDKGLEEDLRKQLNFLLIILSFSFLAILLYLLYSSLVSPLVLSKLRYLLGDGFLSIFLNLFIMYSVVFLAMTALRMPLVRRYGTVGLTMPRRYEVYASGVLLEGRNFLGRATIRCFNVNLERRFVELDTTKGSARVRLYTETPSELSEKLKRAGFVECRELEKA